MVAGGACASCATASCRSRANPTAGTARSSTARPRGPPGGRRLAFDAGNGDRAGQRRPQRLSHARRRHLRRWRAGLSPPPARSLAFTGQRRARVATSTCAPRRAAQRGGSRSARARPDWSSRNRIAFVRRWLHLQRDAARRRPRPDRPRRAPQLVAERPLDCVRALREHLRGAVRRDRLCARVLRCSGCRTPAFSPDGRLLVYKRGGLVVARAQRRQAPAHASSRTRAGSFDASEPSWQPRRSPE